MNRVDARIANRHARVLRRPGRTAPHHCHRRDCGIADALVGVCTCRCTGCTLAVTRLHQAHEHVTGGPASLVISVTEHHG